MLLRTIPAGRIALNIVRNNVRHIHKTNVVRESSSMLHNILEGGPVPTTQVKTVSPQGVHLHDGRIIPSSCIFLDGKVFIWNVPQTLWEGWTKDHFQLFEMVVPKPEILLLGTGSRLVPPPQTIRQHLNNIGVQIDVMDTRNACSTYNLLAEEGRRIAAALLPMTPRTWNS